MFDMGPTYLPPPPPMASGGLVVRPPLYSDYPQWVALRQSSRSFLEPWEPIWETDMLTKSAYRQRLRLAAREWREDRGYSFHVISGGHTLVGGINISGVRRRAAQFGSLGYWMGRVHAGKGLMSAALRLLLPAMFEDFRLHRLEAACIPENEASRAVLEKFGFRRIGFSRGYLRINGQWRDHVLYELQIEDLRASAAMSKSQPAARPTIDQRA